MALNIPDDIIDIVIEEEDEVFGAQPKFRVDASSETGQYPVHSEMGQGTYLVQCTRVQACHGRTTPQGYPASLIVLKFLFQSVGSHRRIKSADIVIQFKEEEGSTRQPEILAMEPNGALEIFPSTTSIENSHEISSGLTSGVSPVTPTMNYTWRSKRSRNEVHNGSLVGSMLPRPTSLGHMNTVRWSMCENVETKSGIPSLIQTAVLVQRTGGKRFSANLKIEGQLDRLGELTSRKPRPFWGKDPQGIDILFDLDTSQDDSIEDINNLKQLELNRFCRIQGRRSQPEVQALSPPLVDPSSTSEASTDASHNMASQSPMVSIRPEGNLAAPDNVSTKTFQRTVSEALSPAPASAPAPEPASAPSSAPAPTPAPAPAPIIAGISDFCQQSTATRLDELERRLTEVRGDIKLLKRLFSLQEEEQRILQEIQSLKFVQ
ncbi:hypothetical protein AbraIFM66950_001571 [Aspergillus brasiliensis]|nr:hypothetical protein AbraIFM66950_001571 [Aspergillus brasiliensis]